MIAIPKTPWDRPPNAPIGLSRRPRRAHPAGRTAAGFAYLVETARCVYGRCSL
jgi:hypothetical protein